MEPDELLRMWENVPWAQKALLAMFGIGVLAMFQGFRWVVVWLIAAIALGWAIG
jgi:hypothetical protein